MANFTYKGRNWLNWENLDERMEVLRHLKVIVPIGTNLVESAEPKRTKLDLIFIRKMSCANEAVNIHEVFSRSKDVLLCSF